MAEPHQTRRATESEMNADLQRAEAFLPSAQEQLWSSVENGGGGEFKKRFVLPVGARTRARCPLLTLSSAGSLTAAEVAKTVKG